MKTIIKKSFTAIFLTIGSQLLSVNCPNFNQVNHPIDLLAILKNEEVPSSLRTETHCKKTAEGMLELLYREGNCKRG